MTEETGFFTHPCPKLGQYVKVDTQSLEPSPRVIPIFAKRRAECLIKLVSKTVPNISTASGGGRLATDYNKFTRRCRMAAQTARRSAASYFGRTGLYPLFTPPGSLSRFGGRYKLASQLLLFARAGARPALKPSVKVSSWALPGSESSVKHYLIVLRCQD